MKKFSINEIVDTVGSGLTGNVIAVSYGNQGIYYLVAIGIQRVWYPEIALKRSK